MREDRAGPRRRTAGPPARSPRGGPRSRWRAPHTDTSDPARPPAGRRPPLRGERRTPRRAPAARAASAPTADRDNGAGRGRKDGQTAGHRFGNVRHEVTVTLRAHPRFGETVTVLAAYGRDGLWVEGQDGVGLHLPVSWTSLRPRPAPLEWRGQAVRLSPEALCALGAWVAARCREEASLAAGNLAEVPMRWDKELHVGVDAGDGGRAHPIVDEARAPGPRDRSRLRRGGEP